MSKSSFEAILTKQISWKRSTLCSSWSPSSYARSSFWLTVPSKIFDEESLYISLFGFLPIIKTNRSLQTSFEKCLYQRGFKDLVLCWNQPATTGFFLKHSKMFFRSTWWILMLFDKPWTHFQVLHSVKNTGRIFIFFASYFLLFSEWQIVKTIMPRRQRRKLFHIHFLL